MAQATPVTCLVACAPLQTCAGLYCSSFDTGKLALGDPAAAGEGLPMLMLHVTKAPPDLPAATNNSDCPASSLMAVRTRSAAFACYNVTGVLHRLTLVPPRSCGNNSALLFCRAGLHWLDRIQCDHPGLGRSITRRKLA